MPKNHHPASLCLKESAHCCRLTKPANATLSPGWNLGGGGVAEALNSRSEHFPAICTAKTMCHVLMRLPFRFVIIPWYQKEVMHTKETPNHHVRSAINHILLNIKRTSECPVQKQGFGKVHFSSQSTHFNKPCFYFGRGWRRVRGFLTRVMNETRFVPYVRLVADCTCWSSPLRPSGQCCCPGGSHGVQNGLSTCSTSASSWKHRAAPLISHLFYLNWVILEFSTVLPHSSLPLLPLQPPAQHLQSCTEAHTHAAVKRPHKLCCHLLF